MSEALEIPELFDRAAAPGGSVVWFWRSALVDEERFEGELVLVNRETSWVIVLNDAGSVLWDALRWPQTIGTLLGMLIEARPGASVAELADRVSSFVHTLASGRVLRRE